MSFSLTVILTFYLFIFYLIRSSGKICGKPDAVTKKHLTLEGKHWPLSKDLMYSCVESLDSGLAQCLHMVGIWSFQMWPTLLDKN